MHRQKKSATSFCPFNPTAGRLPPYLAGREREQRSIARDLHLLKHGQQAPFATVLFGPRGNGKTALLRWATSQALEEGIEAISVASGMIDTEDAVVRELSAGQWWNGIVGAASAFGLHFRIETPIKEALAKRVRRRPLLLLIDEAHTLDPKVGQQLLHPAQEVYGEGAGILLMIAGTPDLPNHLRQMHAAFWERCRVRPIARLEAGASADALRIPLEAMNRSISDEALEQVVQESHGYPFFLQIWGEVLWYEVEPAGRTIEIGDVERARPAFDEAKDLFCGFRYEELRKKQLVAPAAALARAFGDREELAEAAVAESLKTLLVGENMPSSPMDITNLITRLHNLGYIWTPGGNLSNRYFSGIPSLMTFVARMAAA